MNTESVYSESTDELAFLSFVEQVAPVPENTPRLRDLPESLSHCVLKRDLDSTGFANATDLFHRVDYRTDIFGHVDEVVTVRGLYLYGCEQIATGTFRQIYRGVDDTSKLYFEQSEIVRLIRQYPECLKKEGQTFWLYKSQWRDEYQVLGVMQRQNGKREARTYQTDSLRIWEGSYRHRFLFPKFGPTDI